MQYVENDQINKSVSFQCCFSLLSLLESHMNNFTALLACMCDTVCARSQMQKKEEEKLKSAHCKRKQISWTKFLTMISICADIFFVCLFMQFVRAAQSLLCIYVKWMIKREYPSPWITVIGHRRLNINFIVCIHFLRPFKNEWMNFFS